MPIICYLHDTREIGIAIRMLPRRSEKSVGTATGRSRLETAGRDGLLARANKTSSLVAS